MGISIDIQNQYEELLDLMKNVQSGLMTTSEKAEDDFLRLGQQLQEGYASVSKLAEMAMNATKTSEANCEKNDLTSAGHTVNKALTELKNRRELVESKLPPVRKVVDYLDDLNSKRDEIEMIAKYLRAVALNIFIETARSEVSNRNFSIIAEEIKELSENIIATAKSIRDDSENAKNRFMAMFTNIEAGINAMNTVTTGAEESVHSSIQNIDHIMKLSYESVKQAEEMSREITKQVGNIVVGVQFHDDMRQRLEHIVSAIEKAEPLCSVLQQGAEELDESQLSTAHSILKVQKAQIKGIVDELGTIYQKNRASFESIIVEIARLAQILSQDSNKKLGDSDIFTDLSLALSEFQSLDSQGLGLVKQVEETYQQASETTDALSSQANRIHEISSDSHIKALNAIIATQNMGSEGKTLLTLAGEMKTLSQQAENFVKDVSRIIESIIQTVEEARIESHQTGGSDEDKVEAFDLNSIVVSISMLCAQRQNDAEVICSQSEELNSSLSEAKNNLDFFPVISSELSFQLENLEKAIDILSPWQTEESDAIYSDLVSEAYTMEKERKIHDQTLENPEGETEIFAADAADESINGNEDSEFDDNIELF